MKKKMIVIRFGSLVPTKTDVIAVVKHLGLDPDSGELLGCPVPGGMASILHTDKSLTQVRQAFIDAAEENGDTLPVIVLDDLGMRGVSLNEMGWEAFAHMSECYDEEHGKVDGKECVLSLDELLDIVSELGLKGLSESEHARLRELSRGNA